MSSSDKGENKPKGLKKEIGLGGLLIIGLSSAVATAIFFSQYQMTVLAGPASFLSWILGIAFYSFIALTYVELSQTYPEAGGPSRFSIYSHGAATNLLNAMADLLWYIFIPPIEAFATLEGLDYFFPSLFNSSGYPTILGAVIGVIIIILYMPFNYFGVKTFSKITNGFGTVKFGIYFISVLLFMLAFTDPRNFVGYRFLPFGFAGVFAAMPYAMFAFGGARVIPDFAEEVKRRKYIVYALILTVVGEGLLYLLYDYAFITGLNWSVLGVKSGDWAGLKIAGNPFITLSSNYHAEVALGILLFAGIVGPFLTGYVYMGSGSRVLFATARSGLVSSKFGEVHEKYSIPYWALLAFGVAGAVVTFLFAPVPSIYGLINDATVAGYIGFATNPVAMMVLRRQGVSKYRLKGGSVIAPIAFAVASLIVFWNGWPAVPYSVLLMGIASVIFGVLFKAREGLVDSIWYIVYIGFLTAMVYVGSDGALNIIPYYWATAIVAVVSVALFYPIGILSGLRQRNYEVHEADVPKQKQ